VYAGLDEGDGKKLGFPFCVAHKMPKKKKQKETTEQEPTRTFLD
jgi:hypothetical protein